MNRGMLCLSLIVATLVAVGLWRYVIEPWTEAHRNEQRLEEAQA